MYEQGEGYRMDQMGVEEVWLAKADGWTRSQAERVEELVVQMRKSYSYLRDELVDDLKQEVRDLKVELEALNP